MLSSRFAILAEAIRNNINGTQINRVNQRKYVHYVGLKIKYSLQFYSCMLFALTVTFFIINNNYVTKILILIVIKI